MSYKEADIAYENDRVWVLRDKKQDRYTVFMIGLTHSVSDSSYPLTEEGLSIATARADYLKLIGGVLSGGK